MGQSRIDFQINFALRNTYCVTITSEVFDYLASIYKSLRVNCYILRYSYAKRNMRHECRLGLLLLESAACDRINVDVLLIVIK